MSLVGDDVPKPTDPISVVVITVPAEPTDKVVPNDVAPPTFK